MDPYGLPLLNTMILLFSGITVTLAHHRLAQKEPGVSNLYLGITIGLGIYFLYLQSVEYVTRGFRGNTRSYGTLFFFLTGFHGLHVTAGAILLRIAIVRNLGSNTTEEKHVFFEAAA